MTTETAKQPQAIERDPRTAFSKISNSAEVVDAMLREDVVDLDTLAKICLYHRLAHDAKRLQLWRLLLGVLPSVRESWAFVLEQQAAQLQDLVQAERLLYHSEATQTAGLTTRALVHMALIKCGLARRFDEHRLSRLNLDYLEAIADAIVRAHGNDATEAFWVFAAFAKSQNLLSINYLEQPQGRVQHQMNALNRLAQATEDRIVGGSDIDVVVQGWFRNMFAIVLPIPVLVRVYDVVVGGSPSILVYVALALLRTQRVRLRSAKSKDAISAALREVEEDEMHNVVDLALEMWAKSQN